MSEENLSYQSLQGIELYIDPFKKLNCRIIIFNILCLLFTLVTWTFFIIIIYRITHPEYKNHKLYIIFDIIIYIICFILELCSIKFHLKISNNNLFDTIKNIINGKPIISFNIICYHEKIRKGDRGNYKVDVETFRDSKKFDYYSSRDCSGLLILKKYKKNIKFKCLLNLKIKKRLFFADNNAFSNFMDRRTNFIKRNSKRDKLFKYEDKVDFEGDNIYNIINLSDKTPYFVNCYLYILFSFLTLVEFYKLFIKLITINEELTIVKFISTNIYLNYDPKYNSFNPVLFIKQDNKYIYYKTNIDNFISNNNRIEQRINENEENNNPPPNENNNIIPNVNHNNNNNNEINNNNSNSNLFDNNNQVNLNSIHVQSEQEQTSTEAFTSKTESNNLTS